VLSYHLNFVLFINSFIEILQTGFNVSEVARPQFRDIHEIEKAAGNTNNEYFPTIEGKLIQEESDVNNTELKRALLRKQETESLAKNNIDAQLRAQVRVAYNS